MSEPQQFPLEESREGQVAHICEDNCDTLITKFDQLSATEILIRSYKDVCRICGKEFPSISGMSIQVKKQLLDIFADIL